jgi:hypothetical protein
MKKISIAAIVIISVIIIAWIFILPAKPKQIKKARIPVKGTIAIVLDDWGYNLNDVYSLEQIKYPITAAVLPNDRYSGPVGEELHSKGIEIILHLPMEPKEKNGLEKNTIMVTSGRQEILNTMDKDLASVIYAKGVSNHMGSKATSDIRTMSVVFSELKKRHLYFLDSYVISKSICLQLARKMNLPVLKRDVFLDDTENHEYIKKQMYILKAKARARGFAIGIGHDRKVTLEVLKEVMPEFAKEGYKFVYLSELLK